MTHIGRNKPRLASGLLNEGDRLFPFRSRSCGDDDRCSFSGEQAGDGAADATSRAGDDGDFPVQLHHAISVMRSPLGFFLRLEDDRDLFSRVDRTCQAQRGHEAIER